MATRQKQKRFSVGDTVQWTSQAQGFVKSKTGKVEVVKAAGEQLSEDQRNELPGAGFCRTQESYLVRVPGATPLSRGRLYWPITSRLQPVARKRGS